MASLSHAPAALIPHAAPMVLLDELLAFEAGELRACYRIRRDDPLLIDGLLAAESAIEYMAQTVGCAAALEAGAAHRRPEVGLILGTRTLELGPAKAGVGSQLMISARRIAGAGSMGCFACRVEHDGVLVAKAELNVLSGGEELIQK